MNKIYTIIILFFLLPISALSQIQPYCQAGNNGVYIFAGTEIANNFNYRFQRAITGQQNWENIAITNFPEDYKTFENRLKTFSLETEQNNAIGSVALNNRIFNKLAESSSTDSLEFNAGNPMHLFACGNLWFDNTAKKGVNYQYRIQKIDNDEKELNTLKEFSNVYYPGSFECAKIKAAGIEIIDFKVHAKFRLIKNDKLKNFIVYRGLYLYQKFEIISTTNSIELEGEELIIDVKDENAMGKVAYSYVLVPVDIYGNNGSASDTLHLYNVVGNEIQNSVNNFKAESDEKNGSIVLSWAKLLNPKEIVSIDIYKSDVYDGVYSKLSSLQSTEITYTDKQVEPIKTYYYNIILNGVYERSVPSVRVIGMLKANKENNMPPQNFNAELIENNIVKLSWTKIEKDSRGYYLYKSNSANVLPQLVGDIVLFDSSSITVFDTLSTLSESENYYYAVADVNTSYAISPMSEIEKVRVFITKLPIPSILEVKEINNSVSVIWQDYRLQNTAVGGYNIYRINTTKNESQWQKLNTETIDLTTQLYEDKTIERGNSYNYALQCVGFMENNLSSIGEAKNIKILADEIPMVKNVKAFASSNAVIFSWDTPLDNTIKAIKIYRATEGNKPQLIATLGAKTETYTDSNLKVGLYTYYIVIENNKNMENINPESIEINIEK